MAKDVKNISDDIPTPSEIDKIIHEPGRLLICSYLYVVTEADFIFLKNQTDMTWGNLSSHISKLEDAGYINVKKEFVGKKTRTLLSLTDAGRNAFRDYRQKMDHLLKGLPK